MSERLEYYCKTCGKMRLGPLASEANNLNIPCECGGPIHWTTQVPNRMEKE